METTYKISQVSASMLVAGGIIGSLNVAYLFLLMGYDILVPMITAGFFVSLVVFNAIYKHYRTKKARILTSFHNANHGINEYIEALKDDAGRLEQDYYSTLARLTDDVPNRAEKISALNKYYSRMLEHNNEILCKV